MKSPQHYGDTQLMDLLIEKQVPFTEGNIMKYVSRWDKKDGLKDLYKARDYLNALIAYAEMPKQWNPIKETPQELTRKMVAGYTLCPDMYPQTQDLADGIK